MKITRKELLKLINEERVQMEESVLLEAPNSLTSPAVQRYEKDPDG